MIEAIGRAGTSATFDGEQVTVRRRPGHRGASDEQRLPITTVTAVEWIPAGTILDGYIRFVAGRASTEQWAVSFWRRSQPEFERLRDAVRSAIARTRPTTPLHPDVQDRLRRLGHLHDAGILTDTEFQGRKQRLLQAEP